MSTGYIVVDGAICKCQFGNTPDTFKVLSHNKEFINDDTGSTKKIGNTMDIGMPLQAKTFGQCKLQPSSGGFLPCVPTITQWQNFYEKVELSNTGKVLTQESKAVCAISGSPCISFTHHGQTTVMDSANVEATAGFVQSQLNPLVDSAAMMAIQSEALEAAPHQK